MRVVTMVSLGASAVLGLGALVVAKTVLPNQGAKLSGAVAAEAPGVPVVVAAKAMKYGEKVDAEHLRLVNLPPDSVPEGAYTTIAAVLAANHGGPPVALSPIAARETVLPSKLSGPGARASVAAEISEGMRAYTIKVSDVSGVGGHALPGDRVDVVLLRDGSNGQGHAYVTQVVLQDVRVLAIDLNADLASNKPAAPNTATLEVTVEDSQKLALAADLGTLSLALRRTGSSDPVGVTVMRASQFVVGAGAGAPSAPRPARRASPGPAHGAVPILIVYGERGGGGRRREAPPPPAPAPAPAPASNNADAARPSFG